MKADISHSRFGRRLDGEWQIGDPDDKFYIMMAQHMIKIENTDMALHFVKQALSFKADSQVNLNKKPYEPQSLYFVRLGCVIHKTAGEMRW